MSMSSLVKVVVAAVLLVSIETSGGQTNDEGDGLFKEFIWRPIGPANMAGRIDDIEAVETDSHIVYVGATGGVWKTTKNGTTWAPVFDDQPNLSIGDIAICAFQPEHHMGGHWRAEQSPELVIRRWSLQEHRRRWHVDICGPGG
jgi:hypothetical protein